MKTIVISQPMFFPWVGLFEQIKLADIYVHLDDVQFPQGRSFMNRVQLKTPQGSQWLTVPVQRQGIQSINEVVIDSSQNWKVKHLKTLQTNYAKAPYFKNMWDIVNRVYDQDINCISELNISIIEMIADYFSIKPAFYRSSSLGITSKSTNRLLDIVKQLNGDIYVTGHGASKYMDHELFEDSSIRVEYMDYRRTQYPQLYGEFDPHVSILDLISNVGKDGVRYIHSSTKYWRDFIDG